jgi:hypothetical protein
MPLIAIIIFAFAVLFIGIDQEQLEASQAQGTALQQMTAQSAKQFSEFTRAAASYVQSMGLPLPGTALTVADLQGVHLLPSSFPTQTPFGQTLVADYVSDTNNPVALDVVVHTTGSMNAALLQKAGVSQGSVATVQYDTAVVAQDQVPATIAGSTGQFFGVANGSVLNNLGSSNTMTLPGGISTQQPEVAEYILSPGQYGYWLIGASIYGWSALWEPLTGWNAGNDADLYFNGYAYPSIASQEFSLTCPSVATNLANLTSGTPTGNNDTLYQSFNGGDASQSPLFCIPAYKGQVTPINAAAQTQVLDFMAPNYTVNWNGHYYGNPSVNDNWVSNANYVNPSNIVGLNNNLYATGGFMSIFAPAPQYPLNEASPMPMPNAISGIGISVAVKTPQNTTDTYQIEVDGGSLFTGSGCPESLVDPWTQGAATYNVWATDTGGNQNLCGSQETFWTDWHAVKDSGNTSGVPVSQNYEAGGNGYPLNFSVATPLVN